MRSEEQKDSINTVSGVRIRVVYIVLVIIAIAVAVWLIISNYQSSDSYNTLSVAVDEYVACQKEADDLMDASDYLTEQVRAFASTGDRQYLDNFFTEVNETRRRDAALERFEADLAGTEAYRYLSKALEQSTSLEQIEYYSMVLRVASDGMDLTEFPEVLQKISLTAEDQKLYSEQKADQALEILYNDTYLSYKTEIRNNVQACSDELIRIAEEKELASAKQLLSGIHKQTILTAALVIIIFLILLLTALLVMRPLRNSIAHIREQQMLPETGSKEMKFLARTYNSMFQEIQQSHEQLSYEASHDGLTGLYNRAVFEKNKESWGPEPENIALILVDVDHFKTMNDTYGHSVGDAVLVKVAKILSKSFRSEDYVCRTGGDEFAVIMVNASSDLKDLVAGKLDRALDKLRNPDDGVPAVTLSIGVAFSDRENPTDSIYNDADAALYRVKNRGKDGYEFY